MYQWLKLKKAGCSLLLDEYGRHAEMPHPGGSLTKLLTLYSPPPSIQQLFISISNYFITSTSPSPFFSCLLPTIPLLKAWPKSSAAWLLCGRLHSWRRKTTRYREIGYRSSVASSWEAIYCGANLCCNCCRCTRHKSRYWALTVRK